MVSRRYRRGPTGHRVGESHHRSKLDSGDVAMIRVLHDSGGLGYGKIAEKFDIDKGTVRDICKGRRRSYD